MDDALRQTFDRLLSDNGWAMRWLEPSFDSAEQRAWLNLHREFLRTTYGRSDFAGVADAAQQTPIALARIFVEERFRPLRGALAGQDDEQPLSLEDLLVRFDETGKPLAVAGSAILVGEPGAGKSTLVRMLAAACSTASSRVSHARYLGRRLVLPFILRECDMSRACTVDDFLQAWAERTSSQSGGRHKVELGHALAYLEHGWAIAAFDGVDEVSHGCRRRLRRLIYAFQARFPSVVVLITGRPVGFERHPFAAPRPRLWQAICRREGRQLSLPPSIPAYVVQPFDDLQIKEYVGKWHAARYPEDQNRQEREKEELLASLERQTRLEGLKRRPIYLATLTYIHDVKGKLPNSLTLAYHSMIETCLDVLDAVKRFRDDQCPEEVLDLRTDDKWRILEWLAHDLHFGLAGEKSEDNGTSLRLNIAVADFDRWLANLVGKEDMALSERDATKVRSYFLARSGLLVEPEEGIMSFSHLSFQEFLVGSWFFRQMGNHPFDLAAWLKPHLLDRLLDPAWHPVGLAFFGLQTIKQGGSFQYLLLEQAWLKKKSADALKQFDFLAKLISEGEPNFSDGQLKDIWLGYWEIACSDEKEDFPSWHKAVAKAAPSWLSRSSQLRSCMEQRFLELRLATGQQCDELALYAAFPEKDLSVWWSRKASRSNLSSWFESTPANERNRAIQAIDFHACYEEAFVLLEKIFPLRWLVLFGDLDIFIFPKMILKNNSGCLWKHYELYLAARFFVRQYEIYKNKYLHVFTKTYIIHLDVIIKNEVNHKYIAITNEYLYLKIIKELKIKNYSKIIKELKTIKENSAFAENLLCLAKNFLIKEGKKGPSFAESFFSKKINEEYFQEYKIFLCKIFFDHMFEIQYIDKAANYCNNLFFGMIHSRYNCAINIIAYHAKTKKIYFSASKLVSLFEETYCDSNSKALLEEEWFPFQCLKQLDEPVPVQPVETAVFIFFQFLQKILSDGSSLPDPPPLQLQPGQLVELWHGKAAREQYLADLQDAGWTPAEWPPDIDRLLDL